MPIRNCISQLFIFLNKKAIKKTLQNIVLYLNTTNNKNDGADDVGYYRFC
jgi:hypothetical protein